MQVKKGVIGFLCLLLLVVSGCSSAPNKASSMQDSQAKLFKKNPQKSNLYIYRGRDEGPSIKIEVDGRHVATNIGQTYIKLSLKPGKHTIVSHGDNDDRLILATLKNKNYYIFHDVKEGRVHVLTNLSLVREVVGKSGVKECEMLALIPRSEKYTMR